MTLGQIEQLLGQLALPPLPPMTVVPGALQNITQQSSAQAQSGSAGSANETQVAAQSNTTVQVAGAASDASTGAALVNQTGQGIWQVQVGCLFDCAGTQQLQQATQSNTTVQAPAGAPAVNTVTQLVWQLQVGCLFWCYDAVESQGASASDSTILVPPAPPVEAPAPPPPPAGGAPAPGDAPAPAAPAAPAAPVDGEVPAPVAPPVPTPPPAAASVPSAGTPGTGVRGSVGWAGLVLAEPGRGRPVFEAVGVITGSASLKAGGRGAAVSIGASRWAPVESSRPAAHPVLHRGHTRHAARRAHGQQRTTVAAVRRSGVEPSAAPEPWLVLVLAAAAALALAVGLRRLRGPR